MGCLRSIGCLVVLVVLLAVGWFFYRDDAERWWNSRRSDREAPAAVAEWEPLTPGGAERARQTVARLERRSGRVYETVRPGDLAAYVFEELARQGFAVSTDSARAAVVGDQLHVRADMRLKDLGGDALGPLGAMLGDRANVEFAGTLDVVRAGLAQYRLTMIRVGEQQLPAPIIPRLVQRISRGERPAGLAPNGLPIHIPPYIADVRLGGGMVTLIKDAR
ncbi:MAG TPA: hypothetical protein VFS05_01945 [Gemmatimonadaceae bacterium]|nr:hypothetical protein [Gemmatimonadaceae bacterium]